MALTDNEKNLLQEEVDDLEQNNEDLETANDTAFRETVDMYLLDIPFKRMLDEKHSDIYFYEEELRRLDGTSVIHPIQEETFVVYDTVEDSRITVLNGRLKVEENGEEVVSVGIIPVKGYSQGISGTGTGFDIWSEDRHGSTTSTINTTTAFTVDEPHRKLRAKMDDDEIVQEIDIGSLFTLPQTFTGAALAVTIQNLFQAIQTGSILNQVLAPQFELTVGDSMYIQVDGGSLQEITFVASDFDLVFDTTILASQTEMIDAFNKYWTGVTASADGTQIKLEHDGSTKFQVSDGVGSPNTKIGFSTSIIYVTSPFTTMACVYKEDLNIFVITSGTGGDPSSAEVLEADPLETEYSYTSLEGGETTFQLDNYPIIANSYRVYKNNILLTGGTDYSMNITTGVITLATALASADVLRVTYGYESDLRSVIGFGDLSQQTLVQGKYQNNKLKVQIDNRTEIIEIRDFRRCTNSIDFGDMLDSLSQGWVGPDNRVGYQGNFRAGPFFCSGFNNGKDVALSIQAKLRQVAEGGFELATCKYFSNSQQFQIWSGTVAYDEMTEPISSVHVLPLTEDPDRDARTLLGFDTPTEEEFVTSFTSLGTLYNELSKTTPPYQNIIVVPFRPTSEWGGRQSHSLLYSTSDGYKLDGDFQAYWMPTTRIYDEAARRRPRLYPDNYLTVDATNNIMNFFYSTSLNNVEITIAISWGNYTEVDLANQITAHFAVAGLQITCSYNSSSKLFTFTSTGESFSLLWGTGKDAVNQIGDFLGFNSEDTGFGTSHSSNFQVRFSNENPDDLFFPLQFYAPPTLQFVDDNTVDEESGADDEAYYLRSEDEFSSLLTDMKALTEYDNEVLLGSWWSLSGLESTKNAQVITALRHQRGSYANHISETGDVIDNIDVSYDSAIINWTSLYNLRLGYRNILDASVESSSFAATSTDLPITSPASKIIYNNPAPLVQYENGDGRHINGVFDYPELYREDATFTPDDAAFNMTSTLTTFLSQAVTSVKVYVSATALTTRVTLADTSVHTDLNIDLTTSPNDTIAGLVETINDETYYSANYSSKLIGRVSEKFRVAHNGTFIIDSNGTDRTVITFEALNGHEVSGVNAKTRITGGSNDRFLINIDNSIDTSTNEIIVDGATGSETEAYTEFRPILAGTTNGRIAHFGGGETLLTENIHYTLDTDDGIVNFTAFMLPLTPGDVVYFTYSFRRVDEIVLGTQTNGYAIAAKIQQQVRNIRIVDTELRGSYANFVCQFNEGNRTYTLVSGSGGTNSSVSIQSSNTNDAAQSLKIGYRYAFGTGWTSNGGTNVSGTGNIPNSNFVTVTDLIGVIDSQSHPGFVADGVGGVKYLQLTSTETNENSLIQIAAESTMATQLGFDIGINDLSRFETFLSSSLDEVAGEEIKDPSSYDLTRSFDKSRGDIQVSYIATGPAQITARQSAITERLSFDFGERQSQIQARSTEIQSELTSALYSLRRSFVELRLNSENGSYVKIGDQENFITRNEETIASNDQRIAELEALING